MNEKLPSVTEIGGYSLVYISDKNAIYCPDCASDLESGMTLVATPLWEGPSSYCEECNKELETEYGEIEKVMYGAHYKGELIKDFENQEKAMEFVASFATFSDEPLYVKTITEDDLKHKLIMQFGVYNEEGSLVVPFNELGDATEFIKKNKGLTIKPIMQSRRG